MACGILVPQPGMEPMSPALEGRFLTTGPPGKSLEYFFFKSDFIETENALVVARALQEGENRVIQVKGYIFSVLRRIHSKDLI